MSTVRMSQKVIDKTLENACKTFVKANPLRQIPEITGDRVYESVFKKVEPLVQQLLDIPESGIDNAITKDSIITLKLEGVDLSAFPDQASSHRFDWRPEFDTLYRNLTIPLSSNKRFFRHAGDITLLKINENYKPILDILEYNLTVKDSLKIHINQVKTIVDSCVTVNQFVKAWPAGASLIPEDALKKANERSVRKQAAEDRRALVEGMETDLNTSILTSSLLD